MMRMIRRRARWARWECLFHPFTIWAVVRPDPARQGFDFDDHQRACGRFAGNVLCGGEASGRDMRQLRGTIQNVSSKLRGAARIFSACAFVTAHHRYLSFAHRKFRIGTISISVIIREAGSTAVQEVAFTLAMGCVCSRARWAGCGRLAGQLSFFFARITTCSKVAVPRRACGHGSCAFDSPKTAPVGSCVSTRRPLAPPHRAATRK